jgi:hypothetical protein
MKSMNEINIADLKEKCQSKAMRWTNHVILRLLKRGISTEDVESAVMSDITEIIEQYPNDYPYPSCLVLGVSMSGRFIHVVCGLSPIEVWFITAYYPDTEEWSDDFKTRKVVQ